MKVFYGVDQEKHLLVAPRFLISYVHLRTKDHDNYYIPPDKEWMIDSGGFTFSVKGETYEQQKNYSRVWSPEAYASFIDLWNPTVAWTQDYAFYSKVKRDWTPEQIRERFEMTNDRTARIIDSLINKEKVGNVVQGITKEDYFQHVEMMKESGTLTNWLAIGSIMRHPDFIDIIDGIIDRVPAETKIHALGVKKNHVRRHPALIHKLYSIDTAIWFSVGIYTAPVGKRDASLYLFIEDMEQFMKEVESQSYMDEFEVSE